MKAALREPLFHFCVLGLAVFGLFAVFDTTPPATQNQTIVVTLSDADRLASEFEAIWRRPPDDNELARLVAEYVREEIYVREAIALGLDQDDAIIRRRLQMKMEFLTEAGADAIDPDDATLEAHLRAHVDRFSKPPLLAFEHVLLEEGLNAAQLSELQSLIERGTDPQSIARSSLLPPAFRASPPQVVDGTFGSGFFDQVADMPDNKWSGPVTSAFGHHLIRVSSRQPGGLPPLEDVRERVLQDWRATVANDLREQRYNDMRQRYDVVLPDGYEPTSQ